MSKPKTRKCDLFAASAWMQKKFLAGVTLQTRHAGGLSFDLIEFSDGSTVKCVSMCNGPYSEVTPDLDFAPPEFWIEDAAAPET